jgi:CheY-like chemotaxis protein
MAEIAPDRGPYIVLGKREGDIVFRVSSYGTFEFVNEAVTILGWNPSDLTGKHLCTIIHPDHAVAVEDFFKKPGFPAGVFPPSITMVPVTLIPPGWKRQNGDNSCLKGKLSFLGVFAAPQNYDCIQPSGPVNQRGSAGLITGITPCFPIEGELEKYARLEALGILAAGIAHDFNNFLTGIYGNLQLAKIVSGIPPEAGEYLDVVFRSFDLAKTLTLQFQSLTRSDAPARSIVSLTDIIEDACSLSLCGASIRCIKRISDARHAIKANHGQVVQLFCNLLLNARQAMDDEGIVEVSASQVALKAGEVTSLAPGRYEVVAIRDQGPGIPASDLTRIFTPYFTTKPGGCGLGLTAANSIAHEHGGAIIASSAQGQGSVFFVYLPSAIAPQAKSLSIPGPLERMKKTGRVLIMDDDKVVRDVVFDMLSRSGYESVAVASGEQAIEACRQATVDRDHFDVAILDLTVPGGMGGEKTVQLLRKHDPLLVVIALSGFLPDQEHRSAMELFADFLAKPFLYEELLQKVGAAIEIRKVGQLRMAVDPHQKPEDSKVDHVQG